jgi:hypothetical protein
MNDERAETVANVIIGVAVVGVAFYVARTPSLRRLVWQLALTAATGSLPAWFRQEIEQGWAESGRRAGTPRRAELPAARI